MTPVSPDASDAAGNSPPEERFGWGLVGAALFALAVLAAAYGYSLRRPVTISGLRVGGVEIGGVRFSELPARLQPSIEHYLDAPVLLTIGGGGSGGAGGADQIRVKRREIGFIVDEKTLLHDVESMGREGSPLSDLANRTRARRGKIDLDLPIDLDRGKALDYLLELKDRTDRAAVDARLDLERHTVAEGRPGYLLSVYDSMVALEYAARSGQRHIELSAGVTPSRVSAADLHDIDISTVLGHWETHYSALAIDSDRTYNLKVGADHLNGHILKPHEIFSFNEVVGDRTEKEGYRVAPVIQGGELIDGLAGGMCQIASTLHAAAFFAGLDIVSSTPHSRPSAYITMGLDSTVVYPTTDLKLRNPYEFPVVMHYAVNQGAVRVELLGKERPNRVVFEREIKTETGFSTETRSDPTAPPGQKITLQEGYPGYTLIRRRYIFAKDKVPKWMGPEPLQDLLTKQKVKPLKKEQWALKYPSTTNYIAHGSGPATLKPRIAPPSHHIPPLNPKDKPIFKMLK